MLYFLASATIIVFKPKLFNESLNELLKEEVQGFESRIKANL